MPYSYQERIYQQANESKFLRLWRALQSLKSVVSFMNCGAQPGDETSAMLAALSLRDGISLSYVCASRGEGGQNSIGSETGQDLGVLRTAEMERAANVLNMRLYWLSESPDDSIFDFGESKSGEETLSRWGHKHSLSRFVEVIRQEKPDILCPSFLDVPGQHGHHQAMTRLAKDVIEAAADPDFPGVALLPWHVKKLYLPAWPNAGDDDQPLPKATLNIDATGIESVSGWSWAQIAQQSRIFHKSQGLGVWVPHGRENNWPLHLMHSLVLDVEGSSGGDAGIDENIGSDVGIMFGLAADLNAMADMPELMDISERLIEAHYACIKTINNFPNFDEVNLAASKALLLIRSSIEACPAEAKNLVLHKFERKASELSLVIQLSAGINCRAYLDEYVVRPGSCIKLNIEVVGKSAVVEPVLPAGWTMDKGFLHVSPAAAVSESYPSSYIPNQPTAPAIKLTLNLHDMQSVTYHSIEKPPVILPGSSVVLNPEQYVLDLHAKQRYIDVEVSELYPSSSDLSILHPEGWRAERHSEGFRVYALQGITPGVYTFSFMVDGQLTMRSKLINYEHAAPRARHYPAQVKIRVLDVIGKKASLN